MRVSKQQAAENREKILDAAARLMRERGISGVGVDALAEAAGMTHGSVYSQFGSKERLAAEAIGRAIDGSAARAVAHGSLADYAASYLSARHRDAPGGGCALAALGGEVQRHDGAVRGSFTDGVRRMVGRVVALLPEVSEAEREQQALARVATLVGALVLARAVDDRVLSDRMLAAGQHAVAGDTG